MKITIINNGTSDIPCPGEVLCTAGTTKILTERSRSEYSALVDAYASSTVMVIGEMEDTEYSVIFCTMKNPGNATGGATTKAACGFDLKCQNTVDAALAPQMFLGVFDDAACTTSAANATLDTAAAGTIDAGAGTNLLTVTPAADGEVSVTITNATDETVYIKAWPVESKIPMDCSGSDTVVFSA